MIFPKIFWCYCLLILQVMCRDPPTVKIKDQGTIMGMFMKMYRTQSIVAYLGIPYAQPPVAGNRFSPPVVDNIPKWEGVRNGSVSQPNCYQNSNAPKQKHTMVLNKLLNKVMDMDSMMSEMGSDQYNEDCLYLNLFVPDGPAPPDGYAVIAYLHSGDFSNGSPFEINPFQLVFKQKVIVVTIAYRLSILGFFTTLDGEAIGNFGLMDQSAALVWLKNNVKSFGGSEENITLMGHGSGATSVCLHLTAREWSLGTFHKAIIMSGTSFGSTTIRPASYFSRAIDRTAYAFGCNRRPTSMLMECMRRVDPKVLVDTVPDQHWGPIIDYGMSNTTAGFIAEDPELLIEHGHLMKIPILVGFTDMEEAYDLMAANMVEEGISLELYESMINEIVATDFSRFESNETECTLNNQVALEAVNFLYKPYPPTDDKIMLRNFYLNFLNDRKYLAPTIGLAAHMSRQADTFVYRFDLKPRTMIDIPEDIGVPHGFEQIFVWGLPYWGTQNDITWDNADKRVADIIMTMWANFAKYTNPTQVGVYIKWDNFTHANPSILIIDRSFNMSDFRSLNHHAIKFWNEYYPSVLTYAASCCNMTESAGIPAALVTGYTTFTVCLVVGQLLVFLYHMTMT